MNKNIIICISFIGLLGLLSGCEKDETKVVLSSNPIAPSLVTLPDLTLKRSEGAKVLEFVGTPVNPGFQASATYFLEVCAKGNNFANASTIFSGVQDTSMKISVSDLNDILRKKYPTDQVSSLDFRIRAVLVVDAGTGAPGTSTDPFVYSSSATNANVTIFGLPRLDLVNSGISQKIESALGDGKYVGYVKLNAASPFTLKDPDTNTSYGANDLALAVNGTAITPESTGWYKLTVDTRALTFTLKLFNVGLIGSATPNGWSAPDQKMEYNPQSGLWYITLDLVVGAAKFRINDKWDDGINLGIGDSAHPEYTISNLWNNGSSKDIPVAQAGNYTVELMIGTSTYSCTFTKNN